MTAAIIVLAAVVVVAAGLFSAAVESGYPRMARRAGVVAVVALVLEVAAVMARPTA